MFGRRGTARAAVAHPPVVRLENWGVRRLSAPFVLERRVWRSQPDGGVWLTPHRARAVALWNRLVAKAA